jgi:3-oxoacyl-[acyl-carrier protein] reductase
VGQSTESLSLAAEARYLEGKVALVTGASRGIGRAVSLRLAARGARVACVATTAERAEETARACCELGGESRAYGCDVGRTEDVAALVARVQEELGGLWLVVNNAGITRDQILVRMTEEDFDRVIETNLKGTWNVLRAAARPLMKVGGRIVNVSSIIGITGNAGQVNYAASKAGVIGMTRAAAKELAARKVCVNAVAPGFVRTDMTAALEAGAAESMVAAVPLRRAGEVEDVARAVDFLAGPGGDYITGQVLVVDGGLSL